MAPKLIRIEPDENVTFTGADFGTGQTQSLKLTNLTDGYVLYKVKTTVRDAYLVKPSNDFIPPGATKEVEIRLQPHSAVPDFRQHRFLIQCLKGTTEQAQQVKAAWPELSAKTDVQAYRLGVATPDQQAEGSAPRQSPLDASPYGNRARDERPLQERYQELVTYYEKLKDQKAGLQSDLANKKPKGSSCPSMLAFAVLLAASSFLLKVSHHLVVSSPSPSSKGSS